jgi:cell division transport system permease protein
LVNLINQNVNRIGLALMIASLVLLIISITLIRNTIRLSIYSKRFLVRSMQLVGATPAYIRRPFIRSGITQGFFGALLADAFLALLLYGLTKRLPELTFVQDYKIIIGIFVGVLILGILLGGLSTRLALRKYLHADIDQLYA